MGAKAPKSESKSTKCRINKNLISLKCVLFVFFGGFGCLYPFLPLHMLATGLNHEESRIISIIAPLVSILGPLVVGPLADRMAGKQGSSNGRYLRVIAALAMLLAALFYGLLMAIPTIQRWDTGKPLISFACDSDGAVIFQQRCHEEKTCYHWENERTGLLNLTNCSYTCQNPSQFEKLYNPWGSGSTQSLTKETSGESDYDYDENLPSSSEGSAERSRRQDSSNDKDLVGPPHLCYRSEDDIKNGEPALCQVYTEDTKLLKIHASLFSATNQENETHSAEWCRYPLQGFQCNVPQKQAIDMIKHMNSSQCKPTVECEIHDPYQNPKSVLFDSHCKAMVGNAESTFWWYLIIRSIADIFPTAVITILDAAIIIATRETSSGRGDFGRQMAWGSLGWAIFAPLIGAIPSNMYDSSIPVFIDPIVTFIVFMVIAAIILLAAQQMPLSPPEWWWHTKSGMVAIPMEAIRKYVPETSALLFVSLVLGMFWSAIDSYQPWHIIELAREGITGSNLLVGLTLTIGALPAFPILWYAEHIVDYCGHSNILIASFSVYILRYTGLSLLEDDAWWVLLMEAMEPVTLGLTWVTIVLYMRHLMPRRLTVTGQALPVIAHFCLGKCIGAVLGLVENGDTFDSLRYLYSNLAITAAAFAIIYFLLYHFVLARICAAEPKSPPPTTQQGSSGNGSGPTNTNGNYTPLRVYHEGRGRKGHFRY